MDRGLAVLGGLAARFADASAQSLPVSWVQVGRPAKTLTVGVASSQKRCEDGWFEG